MNARAQSGDVDRDGEIVDEGFRVRPLPLDMGAVDGGGSFPDVAPVPLSDEPLLLGAVGG